MIGSEALHQGAGIVDRRQAGVVVVSGADARSFLQSLVSQDLDPVEDGGGCDSLLLQPTGKMGVAFRLLARGDEFWLDTEPGWGAPLVEALGRYVIRVAVDVEDRSETWGVLALRGPDSLAVVERAADVTVPGRQHDHVAWGQVVVVRADWPGVLGVDLVGPLAALDGAEPSLVDLGAVPASEQDWEQLRVEVGVPRQGVDLDEDVIPQEAFLHAHAVSFDKGCFLGQELVCRIQDRGRVTRHLRRFRIDGELPPVGAELVAGGKAVGSLTSVVESPTMGAVVALGYARAEVEPGTQVAVRWDGGEAQARVEEIPASV